MITKFYWDSNQIMTKNNKCEPLNKHIILLLMKIYKYCWNTIVINIITIAFVFFSYSLIFQAR